MLKPNTIIKNTMQVSKLQQIYLSLGANLGNREANLQKAIELIGQRVGEVVCVSSFIETAAWGKTDQPDFLNLALQVSTGLSPLEVLLLIQEIEHQLGRERKEKWGARLLDIDIILWENQHIQYPQLEVPHPLMQDRTFVLIPMVEIAPEIEHPILKKNMKELLDIIQKKEAISES